ncbi:hypothetical protein BBP40_001509 [Aspergillus hancockii]|nr:hypothetical protein BBP40_001509 [Aspergillus hancockii]
MAGLDGLVGNLTTGPETDLPTSGNQTPPPPVFWSLSLEQIEGIGAFLTPVDNDIVSIASDFVLVILLVNKGIYSGIGWGILRNHQINEKATISGMAASKAYGLGALIDYTHVNPASIMTEWQFLELSTRLAGNPQSAAIVGECSILASTEHAFSTVLRSVTRTRIPARLPEVRSKLLLGKLDNLGPIDTRKLYMPVDAQSNTVGSAIVRYLDEAQADDIVSRLNGTHLDTNHQISVEKIDTSDRYQHMQNAIPGLEGHLRVLFPLDMEGQYFDG